MDKTKANKLILLLKSAIREVIKEELSLIIKETIQTTAQSLNEVNKYINIPSTLPSPPPHRGISDGNRKPASQRVFFEDSAPLPDIKLNEAAEQISTGRYDINTLKNFVGEDHPENEDFKVISDADVDNLINKFSR